VGWSLSVQVKRKKWMKNPSLRWNAGLIEAGLNFRTGLSRGHYPPVPPSGNVRTYQTADKAGARIVETGRVMEFGATFYLPFILYGTRKWEGWPGKRIELVDLMKLGFADGVRNYSE